MECITPSVLNVLSCLLQELPGGWCELLEAVEQVEPAIDSEAGQPGSETAVLLILKAVGA